jgi:tetratricopeptide (TPR) repeat protein
MAVPVAGAPRSTELTHPGMLLGTPAYMAPEQFQGERGDAASDQFSFCVALHEGLYGVRPFVGDSIGALADATRAGRVIEVPPGSKVPAFLRRALLRGLSPRREDRWPTMASLLEALERDPAVTRRRLVTALAALALVALGLVGANRMGKREAARPCQGFDGKLAGVWDAARKGAVGEAFKRTGHALAGDAAAAVVRSLDAHGQALVAAHVDACEATRVRGEQSDELLDLRMACLDERTGELRALVDLFAHADGKTVEKGPQAAASLGGLASCAGKKLLTSRIRPPKDEATAARVRAIQERLAAALALQEAGRYAEALPVARAAAADATAVGFRPLEARALLREGVVLDKSGDGKAAEARLVAAARAADAGRDLEALALARIGLVSAVGDRQADFARGHAFAEDAASAIEGLGGSDDLTARLSFTLGAILRKEKKLAAARVELGKASAAFARSQGPEGLDVARAQLNLGNVAFAELRFDEALAAYDKGITVLRARLGPRHPNVAAALGNVGSALAQKGDFAGAVKRFEEELAVESVTLGEQHPSTAQTRMNYANALVELGRLDEAVREFGKALAVQEKRLGEHPDVAITKNNLGIALWHLGRYDEALPILRSALAIREKKLGKAHPDVAVSLNQLGSVLAEQGKLAQALALHRRALAIQTSAPERDDLEMATTHCDLSAVARLSGKAADARKQAQACLAIRERVSPEQPDVPDALDALARAEAALGHRAAAEAAWARAATLGEKLRGPKHDSLGRLLLSLGLARLDWGEGKRALGPLERAVEIFSQADVDPADRGLSQFALAQALVAAGGDRGRARQLADKALVALGKAPRASGDRAKVEAWVRTTFGEE